MIAQPPTMLEWGREVTVDRSGPYPLRVYATRRRSYAEVLVDARHYAERTHLVQGELRLTFAQHEDAVQRVAHHLALTGVRRGDVVLILAGNGIPWVVCYWALQRLGAIAALGNRWWSAIESVKSHGLIAPRLTLCDSELAPLVPHQQGRLLMEELALLADPDLPVPEVPWPDVAESDPAVVIFSAGTTGMPKAVVLSQRAMLANLQNVLNVTRSLPGEVPADRPQNVSLHTLPLFHVGGLQTLGVNLLAGSRVVFPAGRFDAGEALDLIERERVTHWAGVPTMLGRMLDHPSFGARDTSSLRSVVMAGSTVPRDLRERAARELAGVRTGGGINYGLTESGGTVCAATAAQAAERPGTVGRPVPVAEIRIEPDDDLDLGAGEGEILVRAPTVMLGYWGDEADVVDADGWLRTGDLGRLDEDGWLYVIGRKKEVIIRGGENVAAAQVEARLLEHPAVADVAVVGLAHRDLGEEVGAAIVPRDGQAVDPDELAAFAASALPRFAVPTRWWLRDQPLPTSAVGKVLKRVVAAEFPA